MSYQILSSSLCHISPTLINTTTNNNNVSSSESSQYTTPASTPNYISDTRYHDSRNNWSSVVNTLNLSLNNLNLNLILKNFNLNPTLNNSNNTFTLNNFYTNLRLYIHPNPEFNPNPNSNNNNNNLNKLSSINLYNLNALCNLNILNSSLSFSNLYSSYNSNDYNTPNLSNLNFNLASSFEHLHLRHSNHTQPAPTMNIAPSNSPADRTSYYFSQYPLYCSDWLLMAVDTDCIALSSYKEGFTNKLQVVHGLSYEADYAKNKLYSPGLADIDDVSLDRSSPSTPGPGFHQQYLYNNVSQQQQQQQLQQQYSYDDEVVEGFYFHKVAETSVDYPITNLQWDPMLKNGNEERLAASLEVLRLYKVDHDPFDQNGEYKLVQTHTLANNTTSTASSTSSNGNSSKPIDDINTFPPVTSFDWNRTDPNILITSSVDTTCTVWDLHRSHTLKQRDDGSTLDTATVKTQLIAHDSEVFDVKFVHNSTNIFASVGNDGSMRVFDLRSLEHLTIIYEPTLSPPLTSSNVAASTSASALHSRALLKLSTSNIDQHHLATVGINSNQIIIIDMRVPGLPVATLDGSLGGRNAAAINLINWHPTSNYLLTGGDDCQALVWDCNNLTLNKNAATNTNSDLGVVIDSPVLAYEEDLEINNVCWRGELGDWMGVVSGKGFQAVLM